MRLIQGDLFASDAPALGHGVNCRGVMGAGIAVAFKQRFPEMYEHYRALCELGELKPGLCLPWHASDGRWVYNIASQDEPGPNAHLTWLYFGLAETTRHAQYRGIDRIAIPQIGCGIGGLKWGEVVTFIEDAENHSGVRFDVHYLGEAP